MAHKRSRETWYGVGQSRRFTLQGHPHRVAEGRSVGRFVTFLEAILLRFVVLLALVLFWFGTERRHVLVYNIPSPRYESGRSSRPASKSLLASFFSFFCHKAFCCCCNDDCWWVLGGLVVFLCSNPVSFGMLFHDRVCD